MPLRVSPAVARLRCSKSGLEVPTGGAAVAVSDDATIATFATCGRLGINAGLENAATLAGLEALLRDGAVRPGDRVLLVDTGSQLIPLSKKQP